MLKGYLELARILAGFENDSKAVDYVAQDNTPSLTRRIPTQQLIEAICTQVYFKLYIYIYI